MARRFAAIVAVLIGFVFLTSSVGDTTLHHESFGEMVRLPGHVLSALQKATLLRPGIYDDAQPLTLTVVLKRTDQSGFERYLSELYDPHSRNFHHFLTQSEIAHRFGPSPADYDSVLAYLRSHGFQLVSGSTNRLTITIRGNRAEGENAFDLKIHNYRIQNRTFFANDTDPLVPSGLVGKIQAVVGLSNFARPQNSLRGIRPAWNSFSEWWTNTITPIINQLNNATQVPTPSGNSSSRLLSTQTGSGSDPSPTWISINGAGQTVGLIEFDNFNITDISNWLVLEGRPASLANQVSRVDVNGGTSIGAGEPEVLIDIEAVLANAPGAKTVVYDAPFTNAATSFQAVINQMLDDRVSIISNSWFYCESGSNPADAASIDSLMASAAAAGVSVFNATGDSGVTCGGSTNVALPASSPNATAVGASSVTGLPGMVYGSESWWNGQSATPPGGQGGFGKSIFYPKPSYQSGLNSAANRSVPDVVVNGDPTRGIPICAADAGGCPTGQLFGGTSLAAPEWAAFAALLNQSQGANLGFLNPLIYHFANTSAFHSAASMGTDFTHVGLGSPNVNLLHVALSSSKVVPVSASLSQVQISNTVFLAKPVPADPTTTYVVVTLRDDNGNTVSGKTVSLSANTGSSAHITPSSAVTTVNNGAAVFTATDPTADPTTFTATDKTDGIVLSQTATTNFPIPPAISETITALPSSVLNDGKTPSVITVRLTDWLARIIHKV